MAKKILIVDDEKGIRKVLRSFFEDFGYQVAEAGSGPEALEVLSREAIPVIFLDLNMPGMNGLDVCRQIRQSQPKACVYAVTGYHRTYTADDCKNAGFDDFFVKPVNLHVLHNAVLSAFEKIPPACQDD